MTIVGYTAMGNGQEICLSCARTIETYSPIHDGDLAPEVYLYECSVAGCETFLVPPTEQAWAVLKSHGETQ